MRARKKGTKRRIAARNQRRRMARGGRGQRPRRVDSDPRLGGMGSGSSLFSLLLGEVGAGPASPEALLEEAGVEGSEGLLSLLLEPVPAGSGAQEIGEGPYAYLKLNPVDHSMRVFRFPTREGALEAQAIGVLAEQLGGPQPDEPEDPGLAA